MCGLCFGDTFSLIKCNLGVVIGVVPLFLLSILLLLLHSPCFSPFSSLAFSALSFCCLVTNVLQLQSYCVGAMPEKALYRQARVDGGFRGTACCVSQVRLRFSAVAEPLPQSVSLCSACASASVAEPLTTLSASLLCLLRISIVLPAV